MLRKVYSLFFSFLWKNVSDKTAPEPELALNPEPELKPDAKPELEPNRECELELDPEPDEEEVDPIAMLAALPNATSKKDRFNPRLSPIREEESSEYMLSEGNIAYARHEGWVERLRRQIFCMALHSGYLQKTNNAELEDKKLPFSVVYLFKPKQNHRLGALSKRNHHLSNGIISSFGIIKARYRGGSTKNQIRNLS